MRRGGTGLVRIYGQGGYLPINPAVEPSAPIYPCTTPPALPFRDDTSPLTGEASYPSLIKPSVQICLSLHKSILSLNPGVYKFSSIKWKIKKEKVRIITLLRLAGNHELSQGGTFSFRRFSRRYGSQDEGVLHGVHGRRRPA